LLFEVLTDPEPVEVAPPTFVPTDVNDPTFAIAFKFITLLTTFEAKLVDVVVVVVATAP
jgi:hypothetical protein